MAGYGLSRSGEVIQLVQSMGLIKKKKTVERKAWKGKWRSIIKNLKGLLKESQNSGKDHNLITDYKTIPSSPTVLKDPEAHLLQPLVGS